MKKLEAVVLILVLAAALAGMYFAFKGFGMAIKHVDLPVFISGGILDTETFSSDEEGTLSITNDDTKSYEVEIRKDGAVKWRRDVHPGRTEYFEYSVGDYELVILRKH
ncbi:MAG: hypothetical protein NTW67_03245 [Candidatus Woesearchaeota archaeon]|nr:hypothetical protein [Candidatus Woesearchaeota archaeon]